MALKDSTMTNGAIQMVEVSMRTLTLVGNVMMIEVAYCTMKDI
jgi:hypothetical protein